MKARTKSDIIKQKKIELFYKKAIFFQQAEFMAACGQTVDKKNKRQSELYKKLINEEFNEFLDSTSEAESADAVIDMIVVLIGYGLSRGWPMNLLWKEVMKSNMAKIDPVTGTVRKRKDGKVLKPGGWAPPNIQKILDNNTRNLWKRRERIQQ